MIHFRPLVNSDSPQVAAVWNVQPPLRRRLPHMSSTLLEQHVFSKPYFDPNGFIVAEDEQGMLGFVHAGFYPGRQACELDRSTGLICMLLMHPRSNVAELGRALVERAEDYLLREGAKELLAGAVGIRSPFYLGLYGGSNLAGVLVGDTRTTAVLQSAGYVESSLYQIFEREVASFRPPIDRQLVQLRRQYRLQSVPEAARTRWDETCVWSWLEKTQLAVLPLGKTEPILIMSFWDMEPLSSSWGTRAVGLLDLDCRTEWPSKDVWPCVLGEAMRLFQTQGVGLLELQLPASETLLTDGCRRLGFQEVDRGMQFRKPAP